MGALVSSARLWLCSCTRRCLRREGSCSTSRALPVTMVQTSTPRNEGTVELVKEPLQVPNLYKYGDSTVIPICASKTLDWNLAL